ncbi:MAG TPA: phosphodiesterase [Bosea sp. (in: a-proteobacteria)]|jgi:3',5'-cyclic AMP phosphodiesterase CpdA|uniref:phosphodiesterase n=1 Tax=Bosea sp. (in: a-proteobacteria) TaxID=1871050 RepID=UPI002E138E2F|nr:phosphodiesterase [Bosea sp. (in: a-proteobacteria)]
MLIAQITDLHIRPLGKPAYRVSETNALSERALDVVARLNPRPDLLVITGDLTDCGLPEEYELLQAMLAGVGMPVLLVPGNHDRRETLIGGLTLDQRQVLDGGFVQFVSDLGPMRLIGLDTLLPGKSAGALCATRLAFLDKALSEADGKPVAIFMHHPPFDCGIAHMDAIRLLDGAADFAAIVARHPNVERILCGHHHRPIVTRFGGTIAQIAPSVTHQVTLDLSETSNATFHMEPPAYLLHSFRQTAGFVTHTAYVERFPGPYPFVLDADYPGDH